MNELPLPIWFFLLYPLCWIVLFPALTLWSSLLYLAASRFDRNSLPPVLPRRRADTAGHRRGRHRALGRHGPAQSLNLEKSWKRRGTS